MFSSPKTAAVAVVVTVVLAVVGGAVGYGTLKGEVTANRDALYKLDGVVAGMAGNAGASAAGASILGKLDLINAKLDRIQLQMDRLEGRKPR